MISRRLTKSQKTEIIEAYRAGISTNLIAENYNCTPNTINRTVKTFLSEEEYTLLKKKRSKFSNKNEKLVNNTLKDNKKDSEQENSLISSKEKVKEEHFSLKVDEEALAVEMPLLL